VVFLNCGVLRIVARLLACLLGASPENCRSRMRLSMTLPSSALRELSMVAMMRYFTSYSFWMDWDGMGWMGNFLIFLIGRLCVFSFLLFSCFVYWSIIVV